MTVVRVAFGEAAKVQYQANELEMELVEMHFVASLLELSSASVFTVVLPRLVTQYVTV